ncbi:MAG: M13 family metallopeptidase [Bryobacteraceae bacterium]
MRLLWVALAATAACAQTVSTDQPLGFSTQWIDRSADPCENFYRFSCGLWIDKNPVPADQSRWSRFNALSEETQLRLRQILEQAAKPSATRDAIDQRIGDHYAACMDEPAIDAKGSKPLAPHLRPIERLRNTGQLAGVLAGLHSIGVSAAFDFDSTPDFENSTTFIAEASQGGLTLPDRDYYLKPGARSEEIRARYVDYVTRLFTLLGDSESRAAARARQAIDLETALAKASLERVALRDPKNRYRRTTVDELRGIAPSLDWAAYFKARRVPEITVLSAPQPDFLREVNRLIGEAPLDQWKAYLTLRLADEAAPQLSRSFVQANFDFHERTLRGTQEMLPRARRCAQLADRQIPEGLGRRYVEKYFPADSKQRMLKLVAAVEQAFETDIKQIEWMTPATKTRALEKLHAIANKIGYPDRWRDYSQLTIRRGDVLGNAFRAAEFRERQHIARIGGKVDPAEWRMSPPTVNAYYSPLENNINFPAGILQPPLFDPTMDDAVNLGGIGGVIGHELSHGFDDQGRKFAPDGNLRDWWTADDAREFEKRAQCFIDQYSSYTVAGGTHLNGKLTLGENMADAGGVRVAFMALMDTLDGKPREKIDGFTPEQRLFLGWAQGWCSNTTDDAARLRAETDPHAPGEYRVNGVFSNLPEFHNAFSCKAGQAMVRENACRVW